jgi:hypothetical protein
VHYDGEEPSTNKTTNTRTDGGVFVYSLSIRGWRLGAAKVNALMASVQDQVLWHLSKEK